MQLYLGFLASHNGTNLQAIIQAWKNKNLKARPALVISNNSGSGAILRARNEKIPSYHLSSKTHPDPQELDKAIAVKLKEHKVNLVILAGYMKKIGQHTLNQFNNRILNIHPALLPAYGGKGMYGNRVHKKVLEAKEKFTGITIHLVDAEYDHGPVINQIKIPVLPDDSIKSLKKRVLAAEHKFYVNTLKKIENGIIILPD